MIKCLRITSCSQLVDLRHPPVSLEEQDRNDEAVLKGILGQIVGQSPTEQKARIDEVTKDATDLSSFVKRKPAGGKSSQRPESSNKRFAEQTSKDSDVKRARTGEGNNPSEP